ncbi:hypothetical protein DEJ01_09935 [Curtobacterium sp. MCLR17_040]|nr:hypothetical protein DEJ01_09935 [Curtobacterium sp. MCLR17_040]
MDPTTLTTPIPVELISHAQWFDAFVSPLGALIGAALGGLIAFISVRASDNRKRVADDQRRWDERVLDIYLEVDNATAAFYESRSFNTGDGKHFTDHEPKMSAAYNLIKSKKPILQVVAAGCVPALEALMLAGEEAIDDARRNKPMQRGPFDAAHMNFRSAVQRQLRISLHLEGASPTEEQATEAG